MAAVEVACPGCKTPLKAPENMGGKKARCKKCGTSFRIPGDKPPKGDTVGDSHVLSAVDPPKGGGPSAAVTVSPFDFGSLLDTTAVPVEPPTPPYIKPVAKKSGAVSQPSPPDRKPPSNKSATARRVVDEASPKAAPKEAGPPVAKLPASSTATPEPDDIPSAIPVDDESRPDEAMSIDDDPVSPSPPVAADPFSFSADHKPVSAPPASTSKAAETPAPAKKVGRTSEPRSVGSYRDRGRGSGGGWGVGKLALVVAVFGLTVGGVVGGVLLYLNSKNEPEQAKAEPVAPERKEDSPPVPEEGKADQKESTGSDRKSKGAGKNRPARTTPSPNAASPQSKDTSRSSPMLALTPGQTIELRPLGDKPATIQEAASVSVVDTAASAVRRVFPPPLADADPAILWQTKPGFQGQGEVLTLGLFSPQTGRQVLALSFDGDGRKDPVCDLSMSADLFAHAVNGAVTVWNTRDKSKVIDAFDPYADKPEQKKAGLAAVYLTQPPDRLVTVSTAGAVHVWHVPTKAPVGEYIPPKAVATRDRITAGKNVALAFGRQSVLLAVGGTVYQVTTKPVETKPGAAKQPSVTGQVAYELGGGVGRSLALAGVGDRVLYAIETDADNKKEKAVMYLSRERPAQFYRWPEKEKPGDPESASWSGDRFASVGTTAGTAMWFEVDEGTVRPVALVRAPTDKAVHAVSEYHYLSLFADPSDPKRSTFVKYSLPLQGLADLTSPTAKRPVPTLRVDAKGLAK